MGGTTLLLRSETKHLEHRSALTPTTTKALIDAGYTVNVERSPGRIFDDAEFAAVGANLVPEGSWVSAPADQIIVGLKELEEKDCAWLTPVTVSQLISSFSDSVGSSSEAHTRAIRSYVVTLRSYKSRAAIVY